MVLPALQRLQNMEGAVDPEEVPVDGILTVTIMALEQMVGAMVVMEIQADQLPMIQKEEQGKEPQQKHGAVELYMQEAAEAEGRQIFKLAELVEPEAEVQVVIPATGRAIPALMEALIPEEAEDELHIMAIEIIKQTVETGGLVYY